MQVSGYVEKERTAKPGWTWQKTITTVAVLGFIAFMSWLFWG